MNYCYVKGVQKCVLCCPFLRGFFIGGNNKFKDVKGESHDYSRCHQETKKERELGKGGTACCTSSYHASSYDVVTILPQSMFELAFTICLPYGISTSHTSASRHDMVFCHGEF